MKNENQNPVTELTPAEQEMIRIRREEERLAQEKKIAQRKAEEEKAIAAEQVKIAKDIKRLEETNFAIQDLFIELKKLGGGYSIRAEDKIMEYELFHYLSEEERTNKDEYKQVYFTHTTTRKEKCIRHTSGAVITAHHYVVDTAVKWSVRAQLENRGIRFKLDIPGLSFAEDRRNEHLKSAKTIHEKIDTVVKQREYKKQAQERALTNMERLLNALTKMYPKAAEIKADQESGQWYGHGTRRQYLEGHKFMRVTFQNGLELKYDWQAAVLEDEESKPVLLSINAHRLSDKDKQKLIDMFAK